jgi:phosphoglycerate dehydrogenase-like enzyme
MTREPIAVDIAGPFADLLQERFPATETAVNLAQADLPDGAEVVVTFARSSERLAPLVGPATKWVHILSTGIDGCALDAIPEQVVVTCSRGASAEAISEWVMAMILTQVKRLPDSWITAAPNGWYNPGLGTLDGQTVGFLGVGAIATATARRAGAF